MSSMVSNCLLIHVQYMTLDKNDTVKILKICLYGVQNLRVSM